ncbi:MAG TPA: response regulator [Gallionella sp.]|nr:response regulator [Gallionella sp.]HUW75376.1 response regulator [Gallionella sp.]
MHPIRSSYSWLTDQPIQHKTLLAVALLLGVCLTASGITLNSLQQQNQSRQHADQTHAALLQLGEIERATQTGQISTRGYMLSLDADELHSLRTSQQALLQHLAELRQLVPDSPLQQTRMDRIQTLAAQWTREVDTRVIAPAHRLQMADELHTLPELRRIRSDYLAHRRVRAEDISEVIDQMAATEHAQLDQRNLYLQHNLDRMQVINAIFAALGLLLGLLVISLSSRMVARPLRRMTGMMTRLAAHDHSIEVRGQERGDEIGEMARALQVFKQMAMDTQAQTWLKAQVSEISLRLQQATTHREFAQWLTSELVPLFKAGVGLFYGYDDASSRLDLLGSYGLRLGNPAPDQYVPGEGLVGQCAADRKAIILDEVPEHYVRIESASGEALPRHIAIFPVLYRGCLIGVLELAGFAALTPLQRQLLEELLPIIGLTQENLNRAISTQMLLEQTQEQAAALRSSELVMREQKEVLRERNEALQAKAQELQEQTQRLLASEEELRVQTDELQASNEELREKTEILNQQKFVLEDLQLDTEKKAAELERASQYKSDFLANMSHELRTPLNSLLILSRSLADNDTGNLDDEQIESARIIHDAGSNLLRLINDILDLSKIEAGKMELLVEELPLADLERRLGRTFAHVAREKRLDFSVHIDPNVRPTLHTDGAKLEQVLNNLLGNAFKFTKEGSVSVNFGRPDSELALPAALAGQALLAISVCDSGIGIPADKFHRLFTAFEQVDSSTSRQYGGTGLGLAISRRMTQLLGGDIVVHSESSKGSTFIVLLPLIPPTPNAEFAAPATSQQPAPAARSHGPALLPESIADDRDTLEAGQTVILLIEDDLAFARILADMIHRKGYRVLAAADGESGLALARAHHPTGILLDVMLPGMDGWSVIEQLKSEPATRSIPVHFISAVDEASRGLGLGAVGFLTKPVTREAIDRAFERLLHFSDGRVRHLLIVDDDSASRTAIRSMLRADDVSIDEADSAEQALEKIGQQRYDCMVLDLGLPGMSGTELLERLATSESGIPPVVVYSGRDLSNEETLQLRAHTDSIVVKGARSPERLLDEVSLFLHSIKHKPQAAPAGTAAGDVDGSDLKGHSVLLVDDDMRNLFALSKVLRGWGIAVSMAQDGHKAIKALQDNPSLELVLMDIMMPVMDGYDTMRAIRAQPTFAQLPIIALTAKAMRGDREKCLAAGASDYLSKPIDIDKLASMIRVWLRR